MFLRTALTVSVIVCLSCRCHSLSDYYKLGQTCTDTISDNTTVVGTCKRIAQCPLAVKLVQVNEINPYMCYMMKKRERVVCCPSEPNLSKAGEMRDFFSRAKDNFIEFQNIKCFYSGGEATTCCVRPKKPLFPEDREPDGCKKITPMSPSLAEGLSDQRKEVLRKCWQYQIYVNKCVSLKNDPDKYTREDTCGIPTSDYRITSAKQAVIKEFPHMAVLGVANPNPQAQGDIMWIGGGSLISDEFILTAVHVLHSEYGPILYALLGSLEKTDIRSGILYNIVRWIPHNLYSTKTQRHDIGLVQLDRKVQFSEFIRPICLPVQKKPEKSSVYIVAGWGKTEKGSTSNTLLRANVNRLGINNCKSRYEYYDNKFMICAAGTTFTNGTAADSCQGDSGGPLMSSSSDVYCSYIIEGIVSHGSTCGSGEGAVYTRVSYYLDWIIKTVWPEL
ncbi:unnamed protein product [Leptosia nina]|uniref:Peptidase S1 domain-containing protein n=1 Tax=Leptosia nina TaxID=320188 RepID=A0AAV1K1L8_9NEOP